MDSYVIAFSCCEYAKHRNAEGITAPPKMFEIEQASLIVFYP